MKLKTSFITNSSSSTFIVAWPMKITTIEDVYSFIPYKYAKTIFDDAVGTTPIYKNDQGATEILAHKISPDVFSGSYTNKFNSIKDEFCKSEGITTKELYENNHWYLQFLDHFYWKQGEASYEKAKRFLEEISEDTYIYIFSYSDEDGEYFAEIEHGNVFHKLKHIKVNCH